MLAAFAFTALNIVGNLILNVLTELELGGMPQGELVGTTICGIGFYVVPLIFMMLAGQAF